MSSSAIRSMARRGAQAPTISWLVLLLFAGVFLWGTWFGPPPRVQLDIGDEANLDQLGEGQHIYNFYGWDEPETIQGSAGRRSVDNGRLVVPWAFRLGTPLDVTVRWCSCTTTATPMSLQINNVAQALPDAPTFRTDTYRLTLEPSLYNQDIMLEWPSPGGTGPVIDSIAITPVRRTGVLLGTLWTVVGLLLVLVGGHRQSRLIKWVWGLAIGLGLLAMIWLYQIQLLPLSTLVFLLATYAVVLTVAVHDWRHRLMLWGLGLWLVVTPQVLGAWVLDDAYISFRYARNLVQGYGITFNPGGEIVEGYTNFLWTIFIAAGIAFKLEPVVFAHTLTLGFALATLAFVYYVGRAWWSGWWAVIPPVLLAINAPWVLYTARGSGMETAQVTFLTLLALWLLWRAYDRRSGFVAGLGCALVTLARPDGALVPLAGGLVLVARLLGSRERRTLILTLVGLCGGFALLYGPYFAWRLAYYGYLLPNTFYAKTGFTFAQVQRGWRYVQDFLPILGFRTLLLLLVASMVGSIIKLTKRREAGGPALILWSFLLLTVAYVIAVGGDHFPLGRFFISALPPLALLMVQGARNIVDLVPHLPRTFRFVPPLVAALLLGASLGRNAQQIPVSRSILAGSLPTEHPGRQIWGEDSVALKNREVGHWFRLNTPPDTVIATGIAGALPYYAERTVIDALGLNDLHIAHQPVTNMGAGEAGAEKKDPLYVLSLRPDYIPFSTSGDFAPLSQFQAAYELIEVRGPEGRGVKLYQYAYKR